MRLHVTARDTRLAGRVRAALDKMSIALAGRDEPASACLVICDEPGEQCLEYVRDASGRGDRVVVARSRDDPAGDSWSALECGASDVIAEHDPDRLAASVLERLRRWETVDAALGSRLVRDNLIGDDPVWREALGQAVEIALFSSAPTLLTGETGTGKELVCRLIHALDQRKSKAELIVLDCTTVVPSLSGSEFFGHEKGAFTGASSAREGAFALADGGTLFLDEIGDLRLDLQAELLRVLQEGAFQRVGGSRWHKTDFRLVCATHRDLTQMVTAGSFRSDLFHRLAATRVHLPPLARRSHDVLPLARAFLSEQLGLASPPEFDRSMCSYLESRNYPGNVRDLRQLIARISVRYCGHGPITIGTVPPDERPQLAGHPGVQNAGLPSAGLETSALDEAISAGLSLSEIKDRVRDMTIARVYEEECSVAKRGAIKRTAERLDVSERLIQQWKQAQRAAGTDLAAQRM